MVLGCVDRLGVRNYLIQVQKFCMIKLSLKSRLNIKTIYMLQNLLYKEII